MDGWAAPVSVTVDPLSHPLILQTLHNLVLAPQLFGSSWHFPLVSFPLSLMCFSCGKQGGAVLLLAIKHLRPVALWSGTQRKGWVERCRQGWKGCLLKKERHNGNNGQDETERCSLRKDTVSGAHTGETGSRGAHTEGSLCECQSVRSSPPARPQHRPISWYQWLF